MKEKANDKLNKDGMVLADSSLDKVAGGVVGGDTYRNPYDERDGRYIWSEPSSGDEYEIHDIGFSGLPRD